MVGVPGRIVYRNGQKIANEQTSLEGEIAAIHERFSNSESRFAELSEYCKQQIYKLDILCRETIQRENK